MTPTEEAAAMIANPEWSFSVDPWNAIGHCTTVAAEHALAGRGARAAYWVSTGLLLVAAGLDAGASVYVGAVLGAMADDYGLR